MILNKQKFYFKSRCAVFRQSEHKYTHAIVHIGQLWSKKPVGSSTANVAGLCLHITQGYRQDKAYHYIQIGKDERKCSLLGFHIHTTKTPK